MRIARRPPRVLRPLLAAALAGVLAVTLLPATPASAANVKIDKRLFGMHDSDLTSWPAVSPGSVRLWDAGVTWRDIERSPGVYDFSRLDQYVRAANAHGAEVTLVLGMTPDFYAPAGGNATSMPADPAVWTNYVRAVATHYSPANWQGRRGIAAYQVWNEANVTGYWTGTPLDMAKLTKATWNAVKAVDKGALVISPAFAARIAEQIRGIQRFAFARVDGIPAWRFTDAISLNLYPKDKYGTALGTPETSMALLATARKLLGFGGVPPTKPIWNTEVNYGLASGGDGQVDRDLRREAGGVRAADLPAQRGQRGAARRLVHVGPAAARQHEADHGHRGSRRWRGGPSASPGPGWSEARWSGRARRPSPAPRTGPAPTPA